MEFTSITVLTETHDCPMFQTVSTFFWSLINNIFPYASMFASFWVAQLL